MSIFTVLKNSIFITSVFHQLIDHDPQSHNYLPKCRISNDSVGKQNFDLYPSRFLAETPLLLSKRIDRRETSRCLITSISLVSMDIHRKIWNLPPK